MKEVMLNNLPDPCPSPTEVPPAPVGEALEILVDEACCTLEEVLGERKNFAGEITQRNLLRPDLRPDQHGRHSFLLERGHRFEAESNPRYCYGGGVRRWIVEGTLRDPVQITPILDRFLKRQSDLVRRRQLDPEWSFGSYDLWRLGDNFGLPCSQEIAEREAIVEKEIAENEIRQKVNAENAKQEREELRKYEAELRIEKRKTDLLWKMSIRFFPIEDALMPDDDSPMPSAFVETTTKRKVFRKFSRALVESLVGEGLTDEEIWAYMEQESSILYELACGNFRSVTLPPLGQGEQRFYFKASELAEGFRHLCELYADTNDLEIRFGHDNRFAVDVVAKGQE